MSWSILPAKAVSAVVFAILILFPALSEAQLPTAYAKWLDEDVRWIITEQERAGFLALLTDKQRDQFVDEFWARRDPTPSTPQNEFKEEHYRRVAYTNAHFSVGTTPGSQSDRGRAYILYGPPSRVDRAKQIESSDTLIEIWRYSGFWGQAEERILKFADTCHCGDYRRLDAPSQFILPE